jgi:uncharacterized protein
MNNNLQTVQENYIRFGQGDIPGIISTFTNDAIWSHAGNPAIVPFFGTFSGKAGLGRFFELVGQNVQIMAFEPSNFRVNGNSVMSDIRIAANVLPTGKAYENLITVTWKFNDAGQATSWAAVGDVSNVEAAFQ